MTEGYIKYKIEWIEDLPLDYRQIEDLNNWRDLFYKLGLIGAYPNGVGFGNISRRIDHMTTFIISGSGTGKLAQLKPDHYTAVTKFDIADHSLTCRGPIKASSESLSHAAIYHTDPDVNAIIHVHNRQLWTNICKKVPTTGTAAEYGTAAMTKEIERLLTTTEARRLKIIAMGGHEEGIITFGRELSEAGHTLLKYFRREARQTESRPASLL